MQKTAKQRETVAVMAIRPPAKQPCCLLDIVKSDEYNREAIARIIARGLYRYFQEQRYVQVPR